jgi:hypothetical protein
MACDISLGRKEVCKDSIAGLRAVYFVNYGKVDVNDYTYDGTDTDMITDIAPSVALATIPAYKYELKGTSTLDENIVSSRENGTTYVEQVLTLQLKKLTPAMHKEVKLLSYGRPHILVENNAGDFFWCGLEQGCDVTGGTIVSGAAMGDLSGYTLTFTGMEKIPANFVDAASSSAADLLLVGLTLVEGA